MYLLFLNEALHVVHLFSLKKFYKYISNITYQILCCLYHIWCRSVP